MRVWDVHPGYLSKGNLLGQHAEIHAVWSVITNRRQGYSRHPETIRWRNQLPWLNWLHRLTAAEMALRGYSHASPLPEAGEASGQLHYVNTLPEQLALLAGKYQGKTGGRLKLPASVAEYWRQHRHSVIVRCPRKYTTFTEQAALLGNSTLAAASGMMETISRLLARPPRRELLLRLLQEAGAELGLCPTEGRLLARGLYQAGAQLTLLTDAMLQ